MFAITLFILTGAIWISPDFSDSLPGMGAARRRHPRPRPGRAGLRIVDASIFPVVPCAAEMQ
jgi:hypothetical protein